MQETFFLAALDIFAFMAIIITAVCWAIARVKPWGKSELHRTGCLLTTGEGDFKESATENNRQGIGKGEKVR